MSNDSNIRIFYNSRIPDRLAALLNEMTPSGFELITLDSDDDADRLEKIRHAQVAVVAAKPLEEKILAAGKNLKLVHHQGVGFHDTVPVSAIKERGIRLAITPAGTTESVAEHTLMLMLATLRHLPFADSQMRQGKWLINELRLDSRELRFCKVGIIGMGRIGQAVAKLLKAFGASGCYYDPHARLPAEMEAELGFSAESLDGVLSKSQVLTLHVPLNEETKHIIDARALRLLPENSIIINAARGGLIDESALIKALDEGKLAGAGLDCFEQEPPDPTNPLLQNRKVVLTPHIAAGTRDAITEKWGCVYRNIQSFFADGTLDNEVRL